MPPPISSSSSPQSNKIEKAVSAAHTFLQKNPKHEMTLKYLNYYRTMVDVDEYLVDLEAQPYEVRRGRGWGGTGTPRGDGSSVHARLAKPILLNPEASIPAEPWLAHLPAPKKSISVGLVPGMKLCPGEQGRSGVCATRHEAGHRAWCSARR